MLKDYEIQNVATKGIEDSHQSSKNKKSTQPHFTGEPVSPATNQPDDLKQIDNRLQDDRRLANLDSYAFGRLEAKRFIERALYLDVSNVIREFGSLDELSDNIARTTSINKVLANYFESAFDADLYQSTDANPSNELANHYLNGWMDLVMTFWMRVKIGGNQL